MERRPEGLRSKSPNQVLRARGSWEKTLITEVGMVQPIVT